MTIANGILDASALSSLLASGGLSIGGATLGSNALAVTGAVQFNGALAVGSLTGGSVEAAGNSILGFASRSRMTSPSDGTAVFYNNGFTGFSALKFGGVTASFVALKPVSTVLEVILADDSARAQLYAATLRTNQYTVGTLPSPSAAGSAARAYVTDAASSLALSIGSNLSGGGANKTPCWSDGTNWNYG